MVVNLTSEQRADKVRRITAILEKANRPESDASVSPQERTTFREHAERMMAQYGITEKECQPQETRRPNPYGPDSGAWMRDYFNDLFRQAQQRAANEERERREREVRAEAQRIAATRKIVDNVQEMGEAFVSFELVWGLEDGIKSFVAIYFAGWGLVVTDDVMRDGYWLRTPARDAEVRQQEEEQRQRREEAQKAGRPQTWAKVGETDEGGGIFMTVDEPVFDELGDYLDGVNQELKKKHFDHRYCTHPKTTADRKRCRASREASGF